MDKPIKTKSIREVLTEIKFYTVFDIMNWMETEINNNRDNNLEYAKAMNIARTSLVNHYCDLMKKYEGDD